MIYIYLSETIESAIPKKVKKLPKTVRDILYKIRKKLGVLYIKIYEDKELITLTSINKNTLRRLEKYIKVKCIKRVCLSNTLLQNEEFLNFLQGQDVEIVEGKWLFDYRRLFQMVK